VDNTLVASNGVVSADEAGFVPSFLPQTAYFTPEDAEADIIVHTSNYVYARNGMWHSIYLGMDAQIGGMNRQVIYKDLFFIGAFMTLAIYYASTYALRREKQSLLFVLLCIGATMRMLVNGDRMIVRILPDFPFSLIVRCDYWAILLFYPIMLFLMTRRFPKEFSKPFAFGLFGTGGVGSLLVLFLPISVFTQYVVIAEALLFGNILYTVAMLGLALLRGKKSALPMYLSVVLLLCLTLHDTLYQMGKIDSAQGELAAYGFFVFLLLESFAISRDYAESFRSVQELSQQLLESEKLKDRIRQTEMAFLQSQIKPHFLYNTLSVIEEYCIVDPEKAGQLIDSLARYLRQSFASENLEDCIPIEKELSLVRSYVEIEQARFENLVVEYVLEYTNSFTLPPLTIQPLVENAIRHGVRKKAGSSRVCVCVRQQLGETVIEISDDGAGIPQSRLETLLSVSSDSVGLINIHNRLLHMYGRGLTIKSAEGEGTTVSFSIPGERP
jgi:signal transduction histidine kinase